MDDNRKPTRRREAAIEAKWGDPRIATMRLLGRLSDDPGELAANRVLESDALRLTSDEDARRQFESAHETQAEYQAQRRKAALKAKWTDPKLAALRLLGHLSDDETPLRDAFEQRWNERGYYRQNPGWFSPKGAASDPSHWYLPSGEKGKWLGAKGDSVFRLKEPIKVKGKLVREIAYTRGLPILDKFALPGKTASVILTGDSKTDIRNAKKAWQQLNPGKKLPTGATFHHDLLHVTEETITIGGKKTKVLVGKMHLVPKRANGAVFHEGSASVAKKYYDGLGTDVGAVRRRAAKEAAIAGKAGSLVGRAAKKIVPGKIAKGILPFVGRSVRRAIPIVGTGLAILEFPENVEAHGVVGAVARATPVLGDLISAHDLGSEWAKQITDEANQKLDTDIRAMNDPVAKAWDEASKQTIDAFHELAPRIKVTNQYGPNGLVDPGEVASALKAYRDAMQQANRLRDLGVKGFDFAASAARNKRELKDALTHACQKNAPPNRGPAL